MENKHVLDTHEYKILVPLNEEAIDKLYLSDIYENGEISSDFDKMIFDEATFNFLESRLFDFINVECDVLINMYEEKVLENEYLSKAEEIATLLLNNSDDERFIELASEVLRLIKVAIDKKTVVGFYF